MNYPTPPKHDASESDWLDWIDVVCPFRCSREAYQGPAELFYLTKIRDRQLVAQSARGHIARMPRQPSTPAPAERDTGQNALFGDTDGVDD
jgi:hypothetical protein